MMIKFIFCALLSLSLTSSPSLAQRTPPPDAGGPIRGNEGPHGGNQISPSIRARANAVIHALKTIRANKHLISAEKIAEFEKAVPITPIQLAPGKLFDEEGAPAKALTVDDPTSPNGKAILVDFELMLKVIASGASYDMLVFHEFLWVIGVPDKNNIISQHLKMRAEREDELAGTTWGGVFEEEGITLFMKVSFDNNGSYSVIKLVAEGNNTQNLRGTTTHGEYILNDGKVSFRAEGGSCPYSQTELGNTTVVTGTLAAGLLSLQTDSHSSFLKRDAQVIPLGPHRKLGCLKPGSVVKSTVFTAFDDAHQIIGFPEIIITANVRSYPQGGQNQAMAYSFGSRAFGQSRNYPNLSQAIDSAVRSCGKADCQLVGYAKDNCLAFAVAGDQKKGYGAYGPQRTAVESNALAKCRREQDSGCQIEISICP